MKKLIIAFIVLLNFNTFAQDPTPKAIIEKYLEAIGGQTAIKEVKDFYLEMSGEMQGMNLKMITQKKQPGKLYLSVTLDGMGEVNKTIFDGEKGTMVAMGNAVEISGKEAEALKAQKNIIGELEYLQDLEKLKYIGKEGVEGVDCYLLEVSTSAGISKEYYEVATGLKKRQIMDTETPMGPTTIISDFNDYKAVNGVKFPNKIKQDMGMMAFELSVVELKTNSGIADSVFEIN